MTIRELNELCRIIAEATIIEAEDIAYDEMCEEMFGSYPQWNDDMIYWEML
jgi:hypothetical protein